MSGVSARDGLERHGGVAGWVDPGVALGKASGTEWGDIEPGVTTIGHPVGEHGTDRRRSLEGGTAIAGEDESTFNTGDAVENGMAVGTHHDDTGPATPHGGMVEDGVAIGECPAGIALANNKSFKKRYIKNLLS